jgi:hypothetical protein
LSRRQAFTEYPRLIRAMTRALRLASDWQPPRLGITSGPPLFGVSQDTIDDMQPYTFPRPPTDQDFEVLIEELERNKEPDASVQRYGRNGQTQHGVDVTVTRSNGTADAYQCKHVQTLDAKAVLEEAKKASTFPGGLSRFIIYTTAPRDKKAQDAARKASKAEKFLVVVSSWEDISLSLMKDLPVAQSYMKQLPLHDAAEAYMWQLRIVFDRPAFTDPTHLEWSHIEQRQAIQNVEEFFTTGRLRTRDTRFVLSSLPTSSIPGIRNDMSKIRSLLRAMKKEVVLAAKAERRNDFHAVSLQSRAIEAARLGLLGGVNEVLTSYKVTAVDVQ